MIVPVILSGGQGTRLWPLSTPERPKQFLPLVGEKTLFQETVLRLNGIRGLARPIVVCNAAHGLLVAEQLRELEMRADAIVLESDGRNTAPAIGVAAQIASMVSGEDPILLVLPADHVIADGRALRVAVERAIDVASEGWLVTFGIVPTGPETGYGYIECGPDTGGWSKVKRFVEKPDSATAAGYLATGRFLWNSGMFVFAASRFLNELRHLAPEIHRACAAAARDLRKDDDFFQLGQEFLTSPSDSIDYAVMEKTDKAAVIPLDAGWNDVGSWAALYESLDKDELGNVLRGEIVSQDISGTFVFGRSRKIALLGVEDLIVIDTEDTLLVMNRDHSQGVKELSRKLKTSSSKAEKQ